jgi:hypothetical protein
MTTKWNHALLPSLTHDSQHLPVDVDALPVETDQFADSEACGVEQLEDCPVTNIEGPGSGNGIEESLDLPWPQVARKGLRLLRCAHRFGGIVLQRSLPTGEAEQGANRRKCSCLRFLSGVGACQRGDKGAHGQCIYILGFDFFWRFAQEVHGKKGQESLEIAAVGADGVRRKTSLIP